MDALSDFIGIGLGRGAELIEFAFIFPLLLLVCLGIVDFGLLFQRYEVLTNAAREGARVAVLPGYTAGQRRGAGQPVPPGNSLRGVASTVVTTQTLDLGPPYVSVVRQRVVVTFNLHFRRRHLHLVRRVTRVENADGHGRDAAGEQPRRLVLSIIGAQVSCKEKYEPAKPNYCCVLIAVTDGAVAAFAMYRSLKGLPVRQVEVANYHVVVAAKPMTHGHAAHRGRQGGGVAVEKSGCRLHAVQGGDRLAACSSRSPKTSR